MGDVVKAMIFLWLFLYFKIFMTEKVKFPI